MLDILQDRGLASSYPISGDVQPRVLLKQVAAKRPDDAGVYYSLAKLYEMQALD